MPRMFALAALFALALAPALPAQAQTPAHLTKLTSDADFERTLARLRAAIEKRGLAIIATIDHKAGAMQAGLDMPPATLVVFGNPRVGTPVMNCSPELAYEFPLKMLVFRAKDGPVMVGHVPLPPLLEAHGIASCAAPALQAISKAPGDIMREAAGQ